MIDLEKLTKLMMMTQSNVDGEALTAVRKANAMLKVNGLDWNSFIKGLPAPRPRSKPHPAAARGHAWQGRGFYPESRFTDPEIPMMISALKRDSKNNSGFYAFLESVSQYWEDKGYLTEKQYESIVSAYERAK